MKFLLANLVTFGALLHAPAGNVQSYYSGDVANDAPCELDVNTGAVTPLGPLNIDVGSVDLAWHQDELYAQTFGAPAWNRVFQAVSRLTVTSLLAALMNGGPAVIGERVHGSISPAGSDALEMGEEAVPPERIDLYWRGDLVDETVAATLPHDHVFGVFGLRDDPSDRVLRMHYFESEEEVLAFADAEGMPLRRIHAAEAELALFAIESGAVEEYERTGRVSPEFEAAAEAIATSARVTCHGEMARTGLPFGHYGKDFFGGPTLLMTGGRTPAFILGWNNEISRFYVFISPFLVFSYNSFYDLTFWRRKIYGQWNWNHNTILFSGPHRFANDKASSAFNF